MAESSTPQPDLGAMDEAGETGYGETPDQYTPTAADFEREG
ncbi:hypothetical protein [Microbacterium salsuginis]|nr:hypothetical protein [Microbacterium sp. CFH 90308]